MQGDTFSDLLKSDDLLQKKQPPSTQFVRWILAQGDTLSQKSMLHYVGTGPTDAAAGNHTHDGSHSAYLWDPTSDVATGDLSTLAGVRSALKAVMTAMRKQGFADNTSN